VKFAFQWKAYQHSTSFEQDDDDDSVLFPTHFLSPETESSTFGMNETRVEFQVPITGFYLVQECVKKIAILWGCWCGSFFVL